MEIWINPACSKCRSALSELDAQGLDYTVRRYLEDVPGPDEFTAVLDRLGLEPWDVARPKETKEAGIDLPRIPEQRSAWVTALLANPRAIQRPIITASDGTTVVGRDAEALARVVAAENGR